MFRRPIPRQMVAASIAAIVLLGAAVLSLNAAAEAAVGWRTDGTGKYPEATPPTEWSADTNVIWSTPMPDRSNSTPVIVGNKLLVCAEPSTLVCVDAESGEILWLAGNSYKDIAPAEELADMATLQAECDELRKQIGQAQGKMNQLRKKIQDDPENAELKAEREELRTKLSELNQKLGPYNETWYVMPTAQGVNGFSSPTPLSDGEHVWVVFGTGVVACYDLEGERVWAKFLEKPRQAYGHSASPVMADGKLIVHIVHLSALDPATGEVIWQQELPESWATPAVTAIGGVDIIITPKGDIVRAEDGQVLAKQLCPMPYGAPIVHDGVAYFVEHCDKTVGKAARLPETVDDDFAVEELWETRPRKDRYYASPIYHEGLIYAITQTGIFSAIDAETGEVVYEQNLEVLRQNKSTVYPSVAYAGGLLFVSGDNGNTMVVQPGREFRKLGQNTLERFRSSPVFVGDRLYIRGLEKLYCIGAVGGG
jgi:outer membrane protein assembly factor BamB